MCGIAGFIGYDPRLDEMMLMRMLDAQKHRGPDDQGILFREAPALDTSCPPLRIGMAHNRLSILDLSSAGHQPMGDPEGRHWICYNGEFYNSPGHRADMKSRGVPFGSTSDTEVLLYLCRDLGVEKALTEVNGMFAFAFFNETANQMHLCRDRAGQKPLYYMQLDDSSLVFASEIPALLSTGLVDEREVDPLAFDQYWTLGYTAGDRTCYSQIRRLRPGCFMVWKNGSAVIRPYWQITFDPAADEGKSLEHYVDELVPLLEDAVRLRLLADVPVGICLSGGIDSALMALMISRLRADVPAYTIAFDGTSANEAAQAGAIARHLGIEHRVLNVSSDLQAEFPAIASWYGEPFGDASSIPMYFLAKMIREHASVALTGDGGDELFGGYHHYREGMALWGRERRQVSGVRCQVGSTMARDLVMRVLGMKKGYMRMQRHANEALKRRIYSDAVRRALRKSGKGDPRQPWLAETKDPLAAMQNSDFHVYMTDDVHTKVDRMSMAHALECRSPFMDYRIIEWAARLPTRFKMDQEGRGKLVLREVLAKFMPRELYDRPKQGFTPPWETWCRGRFREQLRKDWSDMDDILIQKSAIDVLVPAEGEVSPVLSWMAYSYVQWRKRVWR